MKGSTRVIWIVIIAWALLSVALSGYGWYEYARATEPAFGAATILNIVARTTALFLAEGPPDVTDFPDSLPLLLARAMAPLVTLGAVLQVGLEFFAGRLRTRRIRRMRNHTVVCGLGPNGLAFANSEAGRKRRVVVIGSELSGAAETNARLHGFDILVGDPLDPAVLKAAGVAAASRLICALPNDGDNLETAMRARGLAEKDRRQSEPLLANVSIGNRRLWRQISRSDSIERTRAKFEILPFNLCLWAARQFIWDAPVWQYAELRGQSRLHAVFVGFDDYVEAMIGVLPPSAVASGLDRPLFTILAADGAAARGQLAQSYPELAEVAEVTVRPFDYRIDRLGPVLMATIASAAAVTAVFVCLPDDEDALSMAIAVQDTMRRNDLWGAPVYVRLARCDGIGELLVGSARARRFVDVVEPFGVEERLCNLEVLEGSLEEVAQAIHAGYRDARTTSTGDTERSRAASLSEWRNLPETFRVSNRRAADHIKAKLASAGAFVPPGARLAAVETFSLAAAPEIYERLAELEHRSWAAGRYLDGWRYGAQRDDRRKLHPNLVPYQALDEPTRTLDRKQVTLLDRSLIKRVGGAKRDDLIRWDRWIGLVGKNRIDADEGDWLRSCILDTMLPRLLADHPDVHWTLVTPLAPGSDLVMATQLSAELARRELPHRLLIVEPVPEEFMIDDYRPSFEQGGSWNGAPSEIVDWAPEDGPTMPAVISAARQALISSASTDWVVDLTVAGRNYADAAIRNEGYREAARFLARRCHTVVAAHRPADEDGPPRPGGTADLLRLRGLPGGEMRADATTDVILDLSARQVEFRAPG